MTKTEIKRKTTTVLKRVNYIKSISDIQKDLEKNYSEKASVELGNAILLLEQCKGELSKL